MHIYKFCLKLREHINYQNCLEQANARAQRGVVAMGCRSSVAKALLPKARGPGFKSWQNHLSFVPLAVSLFSDVAALIVSVIGHYPISLQT